MTLLDLLRPPELRALRPDGVSSIENPLVPLTGSTLVDLFAGPASHAGVTVNEKKSLGIMAVWRAVNLLAGTAASLPLHPYTSSDDIRVPASDQSISSQLLRKPHPDLTSFELWELVYTHLLLWGNAYLHVLRDAQGRIAELWPLHPSEVRPYRAADLLKRYQLRGEEDPKKHAIDFQPRNTDERQILHIPGFGYDGVVGLSPIQVARQGLGLSLASEEYGARFYAHGSQATGLLTTEKNLTEDQARKIKRSWRDKVQGLQNAHDVAVLDNGATFHKLTIPPADAQFIESRRFQISEIARLFGVPPHMLMDVDRSTSWGTGIEQQGIGFVVYTLRPWLTRVEQRVSRLLQPGTVYAKYSVEGLLRGDSQQRSNFYTRMWQLGALSTNEIRALEDQAPVDGGDARYRPLNMGKLGEFDTDEADPASAPAPAPGEGDENDDELLPFLVKRQLEAVEAGRFQLANQIDQMISAMTTPQEAP